MPGSPELKRPAPGLSFTSSPSPAPAGPRRRVRVVGAARRENARAVARLRRELGRSRHAVSVHLVDAEYDTGRVIAQCRVPVLPDDSVDALISRVQRREREFIVETLLAIAQGALVIDNDNDNAE